MTQWRTNEVLRAELPNVSMMVTMLEAKMMCLEDDPTLSLSVIMASATMTMVATIMAIEATTNIPSGGYAHAQHMLAEAASDAVDKRL